MIAPYEETALERIGIKLMKEEDYHDGAPWSVESDCTCPPWPAQ